MTTDRVQGFGLGLRVPHYRDFLQSPPPGVDSSVAGDAVPQ